MIASVEFATNYDTAGKQKKEIKEAPDLTTKSDKSTPAGIKATWIKETVSVERRSRMRSHAAFEVEIQGLDDQLKPIRGSQLGTVLNFSNEGVCLEHVALIPEQYVSITWCDAVHKKHVAVVRLKWCRSTHDQKILSGGRVCSMETIPAA